MKLSNNKFSVIADVAKRMSFNLQITTQNIYDVVKMYKILKKTKLVVVELY